METLIAVTMLSFVLVAFWFMTTRNVPQALAMPMLALTFLVLSPTRAPEFLGTAFKEFAVIALVFSAVAIPAHQIERSGAFDWLAAWLGQWVGIVNLQRRGLAVPLIVASALVGTMITASLLHNITSILIWTPITIGLCARYRIPSRWLLCGELVASNLGGFSTSWGDTPNIVESAVWSLTNAHFYREILPANLLVVLILTLAVSELTRREPQSADEPHNDAWAAAGYAVERRDLSVDRRALIAGAGALGLFIGVQYVRRDLEISAAALAIVLAVTLDRPSHRLKSLLTLDLGLYAVLASVFIIARIIEHGVLGQMLQDMVARTEGAPWAVTVTAYIGTMFTEAASWASAVAPKIYQANPTHAAAWALGGGICAGSSSLITAASAGVVLSSETQKYPGHEVTFGSYMGFGVSTSLAMLAFYTAFASLISLGGIR